MKPQTATLLNRLVEVGPAFISDMARQGPHCVLASAVGQMTLARFGVKAFPCPVTLSICNRAWLDWKADNYPGGRDEQIRRGAYLLSNTPDWPGGSFKTQKVHKPWDGHLVLRVPDGMKSWLLDLDLGSFSRPQHSILLPGGVLAPMMGGGIVQGTFTDGDQIHVVVEYAPLVAPYRDDYQTAPDWLNRQRLEGFVDELVNAL